MVLPPYTLGAITTPDGAQMAYMTLGNGPVKLVVIPGAGDGQATAAEAAGRLRLYFAKRAKRYRILYISRRQPIPSGWSVEQHANDYISAIEQLGWGPAIFECNSGGGPIGQWIAVKRPDLVRGLILTCTLHYTNSHTRAVLERWKQMAERGDWAVLSWDSITHTFRPQTVARYRWFKPLLRLMPKPRYPERMARVFDSLLNLDNRAILPQISCPTLVIGGAEDQVIDATVQEEMGHLIPASRTVLYPGYGHGNDQENSAYEGEVARFVEEVERKQAAR